MDAESLRTLPIFFYVRLSYALFILEVITARSMPNDALCDPYSDITPNNLQVDLYLKLSIKHLKRVVAPADCVIPSMFLDMFLKLQEWHEQTRVTPDEWLGADFQGRIPSTGAPAAASNSSSSAQQGWLEDGSSTFTGTFNNGMTLSDDLHQSPAMIPNAGWTPSTHSVPTTSQPAALYSILQSANQPFPTPSHEWNEQATRTSASTGINSNFDSYGDFEMDFDPSNLFIFDDTMNSMHTDNQQ